MRYRINVLKLMILLLLFPINIFAYSNKVYVGGETIGIDVYSKGIYIVGFYEVDNKNIGRDSGFKIGDIITEVNNNEINNINDLNNTISIPGNYIFKVIRNDEFFIPKGTDQIMANDIVSIVGTKKNVRVVDLFFNEKK